MVEQWDLRMKQQGSMEHKKPCQGKDPAYMMTNDKDAVIVFSGLKKAVNYPFQQLALNGNGKYYPGGIAGITLLKR